MKDHKNQNWRMLLYNGLIALLYGVLAIFASEALILTIVTYLGILILIAGMAMLYGVYSNFKHDLPYGFDLVQSLIVFILGVLLAFFSRQSLLIFVILIGSWAVLMGAVQLYYAFSLPSEYNGKNSFIINGLITLVFGVALFFNPFDMANYMVILTGVLALLVGVTLIFLAFKLKSFRTNIDI